MRGFRSLRHRVASHSLAERSESLKVLRFTRERWRSLAGRLGLSTDSRVFEDIQDRYSESWRSYHNTSHIDDCLKQLDDSPVIADKPDEVEFSLWLHDAVYDTHRGDNEAQSASLAASILHDAECELEVIHRVTANILATTHHATATRIDEQLVVDIDLSILGRPADAFDEFETSIREEYQWVPWSTYCEKRANVLQSFLERVRIYSTNWFADRYESNARLNLNRAISRLLGADEQ